jgi:multicomponent Na+:H+ antiporter subunit G
VIAVLVDVLSWGCIAAGSGLIVVGAVGLIRMPDVYTRMHAASVIDTLGAGLLIGGLMLQAGPGLVLLKLLFILALFFFTGPVATHALAQAALHEGIAPILHEDRRGRLAAEAGPARARSVKEG